jgi:hypothetical protein
MSDRWTERLSDYLDDDGAMSADERTLLEAHLVGCAECRAAVGDLRALVSCARALPDVPPSRDLWPEVEAQIAAFAREAHEAAAPASGGAARRRVARGDGSGSFAGRGFGRGWSWPQLAAAGIAIALLSGSVAWFAARGGLAPQPGTGGGTTLTAQAPGSGGAGGAGGAPASPASAAEADRAYAATVADLEKVLREKRNELDPETVRTIEANLKIIDLATEEARKALAADPANPYLREHLSRTMTRKVELLREAAVLASTR